MNEEIVWVCWSVEQYIRDRSRHTTHVQGENDRTLCGIPYGPNWDFEAHDNADSVSCKRCLARL